MNVLVGPNGSGKTNFIDLLQFLDNLLRNGAISAVASAGGVGRSFGIEAAKKASPALTISITGVADFSFADRYDERRSFHFTYLVEVVFLRRSSFVYVKKEKLKVSKLCDFDRDKPFDLRGSISMVRPVPQDPQQNKMKVSKWLELESPDNPFSVRRSKITRTVQSLSSLDVSLMSQDTCLLQERRRFPAFDAILTAITKGRPFNINPSNARQPDDLSLPAYIRSDGSGLSATLHYLYRLKTNGGNPEAFVFIDMLPEFGQESFDIVLDWTRLIFPMLNDIQVVQDPVTGKYQGYLVVGGENPIRIPFNSASDGTLKWLAIVCALVTRGGVYSIEEPENFLHPRMQQFLVELVRESISHRSKGEKFVLSTHSETIVNQCKAKEIILFEYVDGRTVARKIKDPEAVQSEVNKTGFGLGYFYASNSIS